MNKGEQEMQLRTWERQGSVALTTPRFHLSETDFECLTSKTERE